MSNENNVKRRTQPQRSLPDGSRCGSIKKTWSGSQHTAAATAGFPPRSVGASLTAVTFVALPLNEIVAVPVAITTLVRRPEARTVANVALVILCSLILLAAVLLVTLIF